VSVTAPAGFEAAGVAAGLKSTGKPDVAVVVNRGPRKVGAAVFTSNRAKANPIIWSQQAVADRVVEAVVLNSGGANCFTGPDGFQTTHATAELVGELVGAGAADVVVCSTGLIGANTALMGLHIDRDANRVTVVTAVDNLVKGTAGAAVQSMNIALGLPEDRALTVNGVAP
jgi:N-acetylglutamate synthase/N-acetylornithine aminotransferase